MIADVNIEAYFLAGGAVLTVGVLVLIYMIWRRNGRR